MKEHVTMRDIAQRVGVSSVTVSKALNDKEGVSSELKQKIKETAKEMGYRFNTFAKQMKEGHSYNIGVVIPERFTNKTDSFYMNFFQHISKQLDENSYSGILYILSYKDEEQLNLPRIYNEKKVDGFVFLGQISNEYIKKFRSLKIPIVLMDFYNKENGDLDSVLTDNFFGVYEITNYLIKNGHRDIAFVGNIYSTSSIQDRFLGYCKALLEQKIEFNQEYILNDRNEEGQLIEEMILPKQMPTAFVCNCDQIAYNLIKLLKKNNYRIPEDCSVVGFDNDIYSTLSDPKLTTVEVDMKTMSKVAVNKIINKIVIGEEDTGRALIKGKIIYRNSVKTR